MSDQPEMPIIGGTYRHWKAGDLYEVVSVKHMAASGKISVLYKPLYACEYESFDRPLDDFLVMITPPAGVAGASPVPRFELVDHPPADEVLTRMVPALKTAADAGQPGEKISAQRCGNPGCAYNRDYIFERHHCCDPYCPIPGTPGYKSHHPASSE